MLDDLGDNCSNRGSLQVTWVEQRLMDVRVERMCAAAAAAAAADGNEDDGGGDAASEASSVGMSVSHTSHVTRHTSLLARHSSHTLGWLSVSEILDNLGHSCFQEIAGGVLPS
jgi:hypothetical protein